jgi:hypothetical protein
MSSIELRLQEFQEFGVVEELEAASESGADLELKVGLESGAVKEEKVSPGTWGRPETKGRVVVQGLKAASDSGAELELKVVESGAGREHEAIVAAELPLIGPTGCYILPQIRQKQLLELCSI